MRSVLMPCPQRLVLARLAAALWLSATQVKYRPTRSRLTWRERCGASVQVAYGRSKSIGARASSSDDGISRKAAAANFTSLPG